MKRKVFIAWNGDNFEIAKKVKTIIEKENFSVVVGGGSTDNWTLGDAVIKQMNKCEIAIIILEKVYFNDFDFKFSENVMYEWGYLNSKINDPEKIRIFLINAKPKELPTDVSSFWVNKIKKEKYEGLYEKEKEQNRIAKEISDAFFNDMNKIKQVNKDKLQYVAHWDEYKHQIYNYNGYSQISEKLLYGMQAVIYSNESEHLVSTLKRMKVDSEELNNIINCLISMLSIFIITNRLTKGVPRDNYNEIKDGLEVDYETKINDPDLKAWCEIFRKDKLQLCYQFAADSFPNPKIYLEKSLKQGLEVINLINKQVDKKPTDKHYALLYLSFQYRNLAEIYSRLHTIAPNKYSTEKEKNYRKLSYKTRNSLKQHYKQTYGNDIIYDNLLQEYILSLIEFYPFVDDENKKEDMVDSVDALLENWKEQIKRKNYIFNEMNKKATIFMNIERK